MYFTTAKFWTDLTERSVSTAAQAALGVVTASAFGLVDLASWGAVATVAGTSALVAVLKAFAVGRGEAPPAAAPAVITYNVATPKQYVVGEAGPEVFRGPGAV